MQPRFHIVMFHPEIPHNTGAAGRLALATGSRLHLIKPLGFSLDEKHVRRTGLDYWAKVDLHVWDSLEELKQAAAPGAQFWYLSTKAPRSHWDAVFHAGDYLVFGPESRGLPESMLREHADTALTIPMPGEGARSLNLSTAVAVVLYEGLRQTGPPPASPHRHGCSAGSTTKEHRAMKRRVPRLSSVRDIPDKRESRKRRLRRYPRTYPYGNPV